MFKGKGRPEDLESMLIKILSDAGIAVTDLKVDVGVLSLQEQERVVTIRGRR
jgi:hypothetical protein